MSHVWVFPCGSGYPFVVAIHTTSISNAKDLFVIRLSHTNKTKNFVNYYFKN